MSTEDLAAPPGRTVPRSVLLRFRVMALTTAVLLVVLVFVGIPLQVAAGHPQVVNVVGTLHGFLYLVYLVVAFHLTWRLRVPVWQMMLVLLAGTVPFCGFVAERKMTRRFEAALPTAAEPEPAVATGRRSAWQRRWLSRRALLLHLEVAVVAPGCVAAGWWQATRALGGNSLSWVYSVEWPIFALLALGGWWHLVHEDPDALRARRSRRQPAAVLEASPAPTEQAPSTANGNGPGTAEAVDAFFTRRATRLAFGVGMAVLLGIMGIVAIPFSRPSGWLPAKGLVIYGAHALVGLALVPGAFVLLVHARERGRVALAVGWLGLVGVLLAGFGGLLTEPQNLVRFTGVTLMGIGAAVAGLAYLIPLLMGRQRSAPTPAAAGAAVPIEPQGGAGALS